MNAYYQVTHKLQAPIIAGNVTFHTGFPGLQTDREVDGLTLYSHVTTKIS